MLKPVWPPKWLRSVTSVNPPCPLFLKQPALAHRGNEEVREPVVVKIAYSHSHPVHLDIQPGAMGYVGKCAVMIVAVKRHGGGFTGGPVPRPVRSVHEQNVLPTVLVVIEKRYAGAESLGEIFAAERAVVVLEGNAGFGGYIDQAETRVSAE